MENYVTCRINGTLVAEAVDETPVSGDLALGWRYNDRALTIDAAEYMVLDKR